MFKKKILVIGGTGFIGSNLISNLSFKNYKIFCVSRKRVNQKKNKKIKYIYADLTVKRQILNKLNDDFDIIVNLLGDSLGNQVRKQNFKRLLKYQKTSMNLIDFFSKKKISKFIQIGSAAEYGSSFVARKENSNCKPTSLYGRSKLKVSKYLVQKSKKYDFTGIVLRLFQVYGKGQEKSKIIPYIIDKIKKNKKFNIYSKNSKRDFCHINDIVKAIILVIKTNKLNTSIFNVAYGRSISVESLVVMLIKKMRKGKAIFKDPKKNDEILISKADIKKIKKNLGWEPKIGLNKGLDLLLKK